MKPVDLDCTGLACPQPVMRCKDIIEQERPQSLRVRVDNQPARDNVRRFLTSQSYTLEDVSEKDGLYVLTASSPLEGDAAAESNTEHHPAAEEDVPEPRGRSGGQLVFITCDRIGRGDEELGSKLMENFIRTLPEMEGLWRIILINAGVRLAVQDSGLLRDLQDLESGGVSILVCGTCLSHLQLLEHKAIGETTNMLDVVTSLQLANKVITI
jgi:selenium metabolism protein YedF